MAELTKKMKRMRKAVRRLNACVDVEAAGRAVSDKDCQWVMKALEGGLVSLDIGRVLAIFPKDGGPEIIECAPQEKDVKRAYPEGLPGLKEMQEAADTADLNWKNINAELEDVRAKLTEFLVITTGIHEELVRKYPVAPEMTASSPSGKILGHFRRLFPGVQVERTQHEVEGLTGLPDRVQYPAD